MKSMSRFAPTVSLVVACTLGMARAQDAPKPTPEHRELAKEVGSWDAEVKVFMNGPDGEPAVSKGTQEVTLMPGGFWIVSKFDGEMLGAPFSGHGISGYDPAKKKFVDVWVDSSDPHMMVLEGEFDESSRTLTSFGKSIEPRTGKPYEAKTVTELKGDDERIFSFFMKSDETGGQYAKILEMTYKRKAK